MRRALDTIHLLIATQIQIGAGFTLSFLKLYRL